MPPSAIATLVTIDASKVVSPLPLVQVLLGILVLVCLVALVIPGILAFRAFQAKKQVNKATVNAFDVESTQTVESLVGCGPVSSVRTPTVAVCRIPRVPLSELHRPYNANSFLSTCSTESVVLVHNDSAFLDLDLEAGLPPFRFLPTVPLDALLIRFSNPSAVSVANIATQAALANPRSVNISIPPSAITRARSNMNISTSKRTHVNIPGSTNLHTTIEMKANSTTSAPVLEPLPLGPNSTPNSVTLTINNIGPFRLLGNAQDEFISSKANDMPMPSIYFNTASLPKLADDSRCLVNSSPFAMALDDMDVEALLQSTVPFPGTLEESAALFAGPSGPSVETKNLVTSQLNPNCSAGSYTSDSQGPSKLVEQYTQASNDRIEQCIAGLEGELHQGLMLLSPASFVGDHMSLFDCVQDPVDSQAAEGGMARPSNREHQLSPVVPSYKSKTALQVNLPSTSSVPSIIVCAPKSVEQEDADDSGIALIDPPETEYTTPPPKCRGCFESAVTFGPSMSCPTSSYRVDESPSFDILSPLVGRPGLHFEEDISTFNKSSIENEKCILNEMPHYPDRIRPDRTLRKSLMKGLGIFVAPIASERDFISASSHGEISEQQSCRSSLETGFDPLSPTSFANARFVVDPFDTPPTSAAFESSRPHSPLVLPSLSREQHQTMELPGQQRPFLKPSFTPPASSTSSPSVSVLRLPVASSSSFDSPPPRPSAPTPGSAASLQVLPCGSPSFPSSENISTTGSAYPTPPKIAKIAHTPKSKSSPRSTTSTQSRYQLWRFNPSPRSSHLRASNHRPNRRRSSSVSSRTYDSWPLGQSGFNDHRCQQTPPCLLVSQQIPPPQPYAASLSRSPVLGSSQAENYPTCSASSHRFGSTADSPQPHRPPHWSPPVRPGAPSPDDSPEKAQYLQSCFKTPSSSWQSIASGGSPILNPSTSRSPYSRRRLEPSPSYSPRFRRTPCAASLVWSPQTPSRAAYLQASASTVLSCYHNAARPAAPSPGESPEQVHYLKSLFVATSPSVSSLCFLAPPSSHSCSLLPSSSTFLSFASLTPLIPSSPPTGSPTSFQERPESVHDIDTDLWFRYVARRREDKAFEINLYKMIFMLKRVHHGERVGANLGREQALMKLEGRHHESKRLTSERERSERMSMEDGRRAVRYVTRNLWVKLGMMEGVDDRVLEEFGEVAEDEEDEPDWDEVYDRRLEKGKSRAEGEMEHDQENNEVIDGGDEGSMVDADSIAIDEGDDDTDEHGFSIDKCLAMLLSSIQPNPRWAPPIHDDLHVQEQMLRFWRRDMALLDIYEQNFL